MLSAGRIIPASICGGNVTRDGYSFRSSLMPPHCTAFWFAPFVEHPGWTGLDAQVLRGDTVAGLDWINRNRVNLN